MRTQLKLVTPSADLCDSYRELVAEFEAAQEDLIPFTLQFDNSDVTAFLHTLSNCSQGVGIPEGFVPHSTYWLIEGETVVVGVSNIRHALTSSLRRDGGNIGYGVRPSRRGAGLGGAMLKLSLEKAAELGLERVLLSCSKDNAASARVIVKNGGTLDAEEYIAEIGETVQRYWIPTPASTNPANEQVT